jgi:GNAT superfamily N-acetyltransferase
MMQPTVSTLSKTITYRPGALDDSYTIFRVFEEALSDLNRRLGSTGSTSWQEPAALARMWKERRSLYEHLARTAGHFWVAERDGQIIGFARSILRDGLRQLTEFFIRPEEQSAGVGRELMARAYPETGATRKLIIATADTRAQARYLKAGVYPRFPIYYFGRSPEAVTMDTGLTVEPIEASPRVLRALGALDKTLLGYQRDVDHTWLLSDRQGYFYYRRSQPVGYGYVGRRNGPFALLNEDDFPAVLAHAETEAAACGRDHFGLEVPMINRAAVDYLLARGYQMDSFIALFMSDAPFGKFENYIVTSPPFFL